MLNFILKILSDSEYCNFSEDDRKLNFEIWVRFNFWYYKAKKSTCIFEKFAESGEISVQVSPSV